MKRRSVWRPDKDEVVVENGAVATAHPLAAQVGIDILERGGNAVDAAVATGFCLAVIEPWNSSIAGHGQMIVHMAGQRRTIAVDYGHRAPRAATADMFRIVGQTVVGNGIYEVEERANAVGHRSVGVPGITAGMCRAHELFGVLPLEQLIEPAVHYAREGFEADPTTRLMIATYMPNLVRYGEGASIFLPDGYPPPPRAKVVQRDLADTLERIGREGKDALHRGEIAAAIDEEMRKNGGVLSAQDLADYEAQVLDPVSTSYRGYELFGSPVPAGTITHLQILNILESFDLRRLEHASTEHLHLYTEAARHAFADRYSFVGTPTSARRRSTESSPPSMRGRSPGPSIRKQPRLRTSASFSRGSPTPTAPCTIPGATIRSRGRSATLRRRLPARATAPPTSASSTVTGTWSHARRPQWEDSAPASSCRAPACSSPTGWSSSTRCPARRTRSPGTSAG